MPVYVCIWIKKQTAHNPEKNVKNYKSIKEKSKNSTESR